MFIFFLCIFIYPTTLVPKRYTILERIKKKKKKPSLTLSAATIITTTCISASQQVAGWPEFPPPNEV